MTTWKGFKELLVVDKVQEDDVTTSLYLKDVDGNTLPSYLPGQFITVKVKINDQKKVSQERIHYLPSIKEIIIESVLREKNMVL